MSTEQVFTRVQFIGHVLCTTPKLKDSVEEISDWGKYLGEENDKDDINARLEIVSQVLNQAIASGKICTDEDTLKVFTFPEFYWRGIKGAYYYSNSTYDDMYVFIQDGLGRIINQIGSKYNLNNSLFLFGSILTTHDITGCETDAEQILAKAGDDYLRVYSIIKQGSENNNLASMSQLLKIADQKINAQTDNDEALANLLVDVLNMSDILAEKKVYNRCFAYFYNNSYSIQKEFKSKEDFILNNPSAAQNTVNDYLQTMVNYPSVMDNDNPVDTLLYSTFKCGNLDIGVEICLDHKRKRLLKYVSDQRIQRLDIQIVISCGMQLMKDSAATKKGGILFNCDGEYVIDNNGEPDAQNGDHCHSQLKTFDYNASCGPMLSEYIPAEAVLKVNYSTVDELYPHTLGEIHFYAPMKINTI